MSENSIPQESNLQKVQDNARELRDTVNTVKDAAKDISTGNYVKAGVGLLKNKKTRRHIIISIIVQLLIPVLIIALISGVFMTIINAIGDFIESVVSTIADIFTSIGNWFYRLFHGNEYIVVLNQQKFEEMKELLRSNGINPEASNLTDECLKLFLLAQYKTQYPRDVKIRIELTPEELVKIYEKGTRGYNIVDGKDQNDNDIKCMEVQGGIKLYRPRYDNELRYVEESELEKYKEGHVSFVSVKDKYTFSSTGNIIIPDIVTEKYIESEWEEEDALIDLNNEDFDWDSFNRRSGEETGIHSLKELQYKSLIANYTMPFEFLTLLTTFTQNSEYGVAVAELVINNSSIKLNIFDDAKTTEERHTWQYNDNTYINYWIGGRTALPVGSIWRQYNRILDDYVDMETDRVMLWDKEKNPWFRKDVFKIKRDNTIKIEYTYKIQVEQAETWFVKKTASYDKEEVAAHLDDSLENNPNIVNVPTAPAIRDVISENNYNNLEDLYNTNSGFSTLINKMFDGDVNAFRTEIFNDFKQKENMTYYEEMERFVNNYIYDHMHEQFFRIELERTYNPNENIDMSQEMPLYQRYYEKLLQIIDDYRAKALTWKIDSSSYEILPYTFQYERKNNQAKTAIYVSEDKFIENIGTNEDNTDAFIDLLVTDLNGAKSFRYYDTSSGRKSPLSDMLSAKHMLFEIIATNSKTSKLENAMRYILYKITGEDYGVTNFNRALYSMQTFGTGNVLYDYLRLWENSAVYFFHIGQGPAPDEYVSSNHYKTQLLEGNIYIPYGINVHLFDDIFAEFNVTPDQLEKYTEGGMELVELSHEESEKFFEKVVDWFKQNTKASISDSILSELNDDQINALTAIRYEYGNIGNFNTVYHLWKEGKEEEFKSSFIVNGTTPFSYGDRGSTDRAKANFDVFSQGHYECDGIVLDKSKYRSGSGSGKLSGVVDFARSFVGKGIYEVLPIGTSTSDGNTYFGADWCAMFVSYCFDHEGLIPNVLTNSYFACTYLTFYDMGKCKDKEEYTPQSGDIIFFGPRSGSTHTGIVVDCDGSTVYTVEGNTSGSPWTNSIVAEHQYSVNDAYIIGYYVTNQ